MAAAKYLRATDAHNQGEFPGTPHASSPAMTAARVLVQRRPSTTPILVSGLPVIMCGLERDGRIVVANDRCVEASGIGNEVLGSDWRDLFASSRHEAIAELWKNVGPGKPTVDFEGLCCNGRRLRWQFSHWPHDGADALWAVALDVTEERARQARKRGHERARSLANLGAGLAHELRNPLNSALLQLALAQRKLARAAHDAPGELTEATREIHRAATVLEDFLVFARPQETRHQRVELAPIVERAVARMSERADAAGVELTIVAGPPVTAELDPMRIERALVEVLANAIDAATGSPTPEVVVRWAIAHSSLELEVEDSGPGLPAANAPVFDPFFTTKSSGTGLGLAIVDRVVADHGGVAELTRTGDATVFHMRLPLML
jgi:signal transduction histidine kinase